MSLKIKVLIRKIFQCPDLVFNQPAKPQQVIDRQNASFWNELCGSSLARSIGVKNKTRANLERFDQAYLGYYPYLLDYFLLNELGGKRVLDIGPGYGTPGQKLIEAGSDYHAIDIARNPLEVMNYRLKLLDKKIEGKLQQASALNIPYKNNAFDYVFALGCLHHTGNLKKAIAEVYRVLMPGGKAIIMVYNRHSLRYFLSFFKYLKYFFSTDKPQSLAEYRRCLYDANATGQSPPYTDFSTKKEIKQMLKSFTTVTIDVQNCYQIEFYFKVRHFLIFPREKLLNNLGRILGLDLYIIAQE